MTIKPHEEWGSEVPRPADLVVVPDDAGLARHLTTDPDAPVALSGGDLFRTIGARPVADREVLRQLPLDLLRVSLDERGPLTAVAHVVVRSPWWRGSWWRGPVSMVMNAEFVGDWEVAARGHPNDGRAEWFELDGSTSIRQRRAIAHRLPSASHLPHPSITRRTGRSHELFLAAPSTVLVDGVDQGRARRVHVTVDADAAVFFA